MFWIPGLSIMIFVLTIIPFIIYGYKKGWLYSLVFFVVLWIITLSFVGINYLLYKYLWKIYTSLIFKKSNNYLINLEYLSQFYKTQIILFVTGIEFILIYPITFLLMFFVNKKIKKYLGHKIKNISKNEKEIIYRRNIRASRIGGTLILSTSAILASSLIASAFNIVFTPYKKSNIINSTNDFMGKMYSLGLTNNSKSAQIISSFINNELNSELADSMNELTHIRSNEERELNVFPNILKIQKFENNFGIFKNLIQDKEAAKAVFLSIIRVNKNSLNPLAFDTNTASNYSDSNNNRIGYDKYVDEGVSSDIIEFENYATNHKLKIKLPNFLIELLIKRFEESFINFNELIFQRNYDLAKNKKREQNVILENKIKQRKNFLLSMEIEKNQRKKNIEKLENISGTKLTSPTFESSDALNFPIHNINRINPGTGTFEEQKVLEDQKYQIKEEKLRVKDKKLQEYNNFFNNIYSGEKLKLDEKEKQYNLEKNQLKLLKNNLNTKENEIQAFNASIKTLENEIKNLNETIRILKSEISKLENSKKPIITSIQNKINKLKIDLNSKNVKLNQNQQNLNNKKNQLQESRNNKDELNKQIKDKEGIIIPNVKSSWNQAKLVFAPFEDQKNRLENQKNNAKQEYNKAEESYNNQEQKIDELKQLYDNLIIDLQNKNKNIIYFKNKIDELNNVNEALRFISPARNWREETNDNSIFYQRNIIKFFEDKLIQLKQIVDRKKLLYKNVKEKILLIYKKLLGG